MDSANNPTDAHGSIEADFERVVTKLGRVPTTSEYDKLSDHSSQKLADALGDGSWMRV